jgi:hypothetical protein
MVYVVMATTMMVEEEVIQQILDKSDHLQSNIFHLCLS